MNKFLERLRAFMLGRYGADELYKFCTAVLFVLLIVNIFLRSAAVSLLIAVLIIWCYFRFLSKNIYARQLENRAYLRFKDKFFGFFRIWKLRFRDRKTHFYKKCPVCKKMLRLPRRKGTHTVNCPQCKKDFTVKIR